MILNSHSHRRNTCPEPNCMHRESSPASRAVHLKDFHKKTWKDAVEMVNQRLANGEKKLSLALAKKRKFRARQQESVGRAKFFGAEEETVFSEFLKYRSEKKMAPQYSDIANALNFRMAEGNQAFQCMGNEVFIGQYNAEKCAGLHT